jgi:hypothetical protein
MLPTTRPSTWGVGKIPQPLWPSANMPTAVMPTVPAMDVKIVGSRRVAMPSKALNNLGSGHGSSMAERNQAGDPLFDGTGLDCTARIS